MIDQIIFAQEIVHDVCSIIFILLATKFFVCVSIAPAENVEMYYQVSLQTAVNFPRLY
jgi:hypothetical protein